MRAVSSCPSAAPGADSAGDAAGDADALRRWLDAQPTEAAWPVATDAPDGGTASGPAIARPPAAPAEPAPPGASAPPAALVPLPAFAGDTDALFAALYAELKRLAAAQMRREGAGHTLSATALTHEAWFRLGAQTRTRWASRGHFLAMSAVMMRRILVNHALARRAARRDAGLQVSMTLAEAVLPGAGDGAGEVVRVHDALLAFEQVDPRAAQVVELRFFGGLGHAEIAQVLGVSVPTVQRDWTLARAWLRRALD